MYEIGERLLVSSDRYWREENGKFLGGKFRKVRNMGMLNKIICNSDSTQWESGENLYTVRRHSIVDDVGL